MNLTDNIIERLSKIAELEFADSVKVYKEDTPDIHHKSISLIEGESYDKYNYAPQITGKIFETGIALRVLWQKDAGKKSELNRLFHRLKTKLLEYRTDTTWHNGHIVDAGEIETKYDDNGKELFWYRMCNFQCLIFADDRSYEDIIFSDYLNIWESDFTDRRVYG